MLALKMYVLGQGALVHERLFVAHSLFGTGVARLNAELTNVPKTADAQASALLHLNSSKGYSCFVFFYTLDPFVFLCVSIAGLHCAQAAC